MDLRASKLLAALIIAGAGAGLAAAVPAHAGVSEVAAGVTLSQPVGNASMLLNVPVGVQADTRFEGLGFMGDFLRFQVSGRWEPFKVKTLGNSNFNLISLLGGVQASGGPGFAGISPFFSLLVGGVYESLSITGATTSGLNASIAFAMQIAPGLDITLYRKLGLSLAFPYEVIFVKTPVPIWSSVLSVRWKL